MPATTANDLRSEAKSYQRDKNHTTKWAKGFALRPGQKCTHAAAGRGCTECTLTRPAPMPNRSVANFVGNRHRREVGRAETLVRKARRNEIDEGIEDSLAHASDNSSDDEAHYAATAFLPTEADFMYSYDAAGGPAMGRDVLSAALNQAVQRFENTETEKLVTREYDVIDHLKDGYTASEDDEDDFEMIEHAHVK